MKQSLLCLVFFTVMPSGSAADAPKVHDPRLRIERFAADPDIVHPIGIACDNRGRLLVIESHTHFRPPNYKGPKADRVRLLEDTDGDGKADRLSTFFEGTRFTMDIAVHPDGSVYLATRNEILRLRDRDGDGKADEQRRIVFLETKGDYPHNGLSGLAFDSKGDLFFGMGENIGFAYKLIGSDKTALTGGGEGGNVYRCTAEGRNLRRIATGFWNPFGICRDIFGRIFAVDNDPDAMPPCRLIHVVEGGDYGYQYRYGRSGRHPFQSWDGQLPGTLPMMSGTGEAPCEIVSYESDGLLAEYRGNLLVASWADHRVERYEIRERGASYEAIRKPFVRGGENFRPVGIAIASDGSLYVSDWVRSNYELHGKGAIWHIRPLQPGKYDRPTDPSRGLFSLHRPLRDAAARRLAATDDGRDLLRTQLRSPDARIRAASLTALIDAGDRRLDLNDIAEKDPLTPLRALAVRALAERGDDADHFLDAKYPASVRLEAIASLKVAANLPRLLRLLSDADPFLRSAAVRQLSRQPELLATIDVSSRMEPMQRVGLLLAWRATGKMESVRRLPAFLTDPDEDVRFLAIKWIADGKLKEYRPRISEMLKDRRLNVRLFFACSAALARLDDRDVSEASMADYFLAQLRQKSSQPALRVLALQMVPANHPKLTLDLLSDLLKSGDTALQLEAARSLSEHPKPGRARLLLDAVDSKSLDDTVRVQAILGLAEQAGKHVDRLLTFARGDNVVLREEALRALKDTPLTAVQRKNLDEVARKEKQSAALVARLLGKPFFKDRPRTEDLDAWLKRMEGPADAASGRRVFFHPKLAACSRCHRVDGRGQNVGPDLSSIGRTERRHILESILRPSNTVAPHYQAWHIETADGKIRDGMLLRTELDVYTYVDAKGGQFKLNTRNIVESRPLPTSIMPDGLVDLLTDKEIRDLMAYLCSRR